MTEGAVVRPVYPPDFPQVVRLLRRLDPRRSPERWRPIFDYGWRRPDDPVGYAVFDRTEVVGYIGMILSEMSVDGELERLCNLTSWVTNDAHRGAGALLVLPLKRLRDHTITSLTSNQDAARVLIRLGFEVLDTEWTILRPTRRLLARQVDAWPRIITDPAAIEPMLSLTDTRILTDHRPYARHLLAIAEGGYCYIVYSIRNRWGMRAAHLHHVSDREVFRRCWPRIHTSLIARHGALLGEADSRLLAGVAISGSVQKRMGSPRLFKSRRLRPEQVSDLYNEIMLLNLL